MEDDYDVRNRERYSKLLRSYKSPELPGNIIPQLLV